MQSGLSDLVRCFCIQTQRVRVFLAGDVGGDGWFQPLFAQLLEHRRAEQGIFQRSRSQCNQRVLVSATEPFRVGP
jgi:hypothetical protein